MLLSSIRQHILDRAIRGQLVPQLPEEDTAEELYQQIQAEKQALIANGTIKKEKPLDILEEGKLPFPIPATWKWIRLGTICSKLTDGSHNPPHKADAGYRVISAKNIKEGTIIFSEADRLCTQEGFNKENPRTQISRDDIILGIIGGSIGNVGIYEHDEPVIAQRSIAVINTLCDNRYLKIVLESTHCQDSLKEKTNGSAQGGVYLGKLANLSIPLPPQQEQIRIVQRVATLFSALTTITASKKRIASIQTELTKRILEQAIQGKIVPQLPEEDTAEELYQQIQAEKQRLIAAGAIKKEKPLPPIEEKDIPFDIPETWRWVRLQELSTLITKGTTPRGGNMSYCASGIAFLRAENVAGYTQLDTSTLKFISEETHLTALKRSILEADDILITIAGTLGRTAIVTKQDLPLNANQAIAFIRPIPHSDIALKYIVYALNAPLIQERLLKQQKVTAIPNLTLENIAACCIPLPPSDEQKRIVAKIEEMLTLCQVLK